MKNNLELRLQSLKEELNSTYTNSRTLELIYSTNPNIPSRTSEAKKLRVLREKINSLEKYMKCSEIESRLPDFTKMTKGEIKAFVDSSPVLHYCPVFTEYDCYEVVNDDYYGLILIHSYYHEDGWIAKGNGVKITPRVAKYLNSIGF